MERTTNSVGEHDDILNSHLAAARAGNRRLTKGDLVNALLCYSPFSIGRRTFAR